MQQPPAARRDRHRVVITGLGAVTPLGNDRESSWANILAGRSGAAAVTGFDASDLPCRIAAQVKDFDVSPYVNGKDARRMSRASQLAVAAAAQAVADAGLDNGLPEPERVGVAIGTAMGGFEKSHGAMLTYYEKGLGRTNPFALTSSLANMPSHHVSVMLQALGPLLTPVGACASGAQAVGEGLEMIRRGAADVMVTGGVEGLVIQSTMVGFCAMRAMPVDYNETPEAASRPFDANRSGFVLGEGAGALVLERLDHALARNAPIYGELSGYASCADAYHMAIPEPEGNGAARAMRWALQDAGVAPEQVDYINAHGSSTPINDSLETKAAKKVFGDHAYALAMSSTKSMTGHLLGAAGAVEALFTALALRDGMLPPTINYETPDPECDLDYVPNVARAAEIDVAMTNAFGLGGQNASLLLRRYKQA